MILINTEVNTLKITITSLMKWKVYYIRPRVGTPESRHLKLQVCFLIGQIMHKIIYFKEMLKRSNEAMYAKVQFSLVMIIGELYFWEVGKMYITFSLIAYSTFQFT